MMKQQLVGRTSWSTRGCASLASRNDRLLEAVGFLSWRSIGPRRRSRRGAIRRGPAACRAPFAPSESLDSGVLGALTCTWEATCRAEALHQPPDHRVAALSPSAVMAFVLSLGADHRRRAAQQADCKKSPAGPQAARGLLIGHKDVRRANVAPRQDPVRLSSGVLWQRVFSIRAYRGVASMVRGGGRRPTTLRPWLDFRALPRSSPYNSGSWVHSR
jgi:hypothetical protein